jgi:hypothetical protein
MFQNIFQLCRLKSVVIILIKILHYLFYEAVKILVSFLVPLNFVILKSIFALKFI